MQLKYVFIFDTKGPRFVPSEQAAISPYDHGILYGDGIFEGIRIYNGRIFKLTEHIERLYESAEAIDLQIPLTKTELTARTVELCRLNKLEEYGYIRAVVTRGVGDLGINPKKCPTPTIFVLAEFIQMYPPVAYEAGLEVIIAETHRVSARSLSPNVKSLNYLNNILAVIEANRAGAHEAIMLDSDGYIAECTGDNFFTVCRGAVYTPTERNCLKGVTRGVVKEICLRDEIKFFETDIPLRDLHKKADECFLTGTAAELVPVVKVLNAPLGNGSFGELVIGDGKPGPMTKQLITEFRKYTTMPENGIAICD